MKGLIANITKSILQYETSRRWQRRFNADMISRVSHLNLRRQARTLAKLVDALEKEKDDLQESLVRACALNEDYADEIDRLLRTDGSQGSVVGP
jgi:hypothetical protein